MDTSQILLFWTFSIATDLSQSASTTRHYYYYYSVHRHEYLLLYQDKLPAAAAEGQKKIFFSLVLSIYLRSVSYKTVSIIYAQCLLEASDQGSRSRPSLIHNFEAHYLPLVMRSEFHFY